MRLLVSAPPVLTLAGTLLISTTSAFPTKTTIMAAATTTFPPAARTSLELAQKDILTVTAAAPSTTRTHKSTSTSTHYGEPPLGYSKGSSIPILPILLPILALVALVILGIVIWKYRSRIFRRRGKKAAEPEDQLVEREYAPKPSDDKSEGTPPPPDSNSLDPKERSVSLPRLAVSGSMHFDANKFSGDEVRPTNSRSHGPALVMPKLMEAPPTPPRSPVEMPRNNHSDTNKSSNVDEIRPVASKLGESTLTMPMITDAAPTPHPSPIELPCSEALRRASQDTTPTKQQQNSISTDSISTDSPLPTSLLPGRPRSGNWPLMAEVLETTNTTPAACNHSLSKHPMTALASPGYTPSQYEPSPPPSNHSRAPRPMSLPQAYSASTFPGTPHIVEEDSESEAEDTPPKRPMNMQQADSMAFLMPASPSPKPVQDTTIPLTKESLDDSPKHMNRGSMDTNSGSKDKNRGWMAAPFTLPEKEDPREKSSGFVRSYSEILNDSAVALPHSGGVAIPRESAVARVDRPLGIVLGTRDNWENVTVGRGGKKELRGTQDSEAVVKKEPESGSESEEDLYGVSDEEGELKGGKQNETKIVKENDTNNSKGIPTNNNKETKTPEVKKELPTGIPKAPSPSRDYLSERDEPTPTRFVPGLAKVDEVLEDEKPIVTNRTSGIYKAPAWAYESTGELSALGRFSFS